MSKLSRRDFLKASVAGAGVLSLSAILEACGVHPAGSVTPTIPPTPSPDTFSSFPTETLPSTTEVPPEPSNTPVIPPDLAVARGLEPEELVRRALAALGGMQRFVHPGAHVVVKPNICVAYRTFEYAATTNPWVVGALVKLCFEAGAASVKVMDNPFNGTQQEAYEMSGIREQVETAGGEMAYMVPDKFIERTIPNGVILKRAAVHEDILNAEVLINVPIAKQHGSSARLTLGMKNLMGVIWDRGALHTNLGQCIADLSTLIRPQLTVIDAVRIMTANGPSGGSLSYVKKLDTVIASPDIVAADSYAASLFGLKPEDLAYVLAAMAVGLGRSDLQNMKIEQISLGT